MTKVKYYPHAVVLVAVGFVSCGQAIHISHAEAPGNVGPNTNGIPFYGKVGICKQQTVWVEPTYNLTLVTISNQAGKELSTPIGVRLISQFTYTSPEFRELVSLIENLTPDKDAAAVIRQFSKLPAYTSFRDGSQSGLLPQPQNRYLAANRTIPETVVNYRDIFYYNVKKPALGTVNASIELNSDGTLSKATAQIEDKTLQAVLDLLPVKDIFSAAAKSLVLALDGGGPLRFKLTIEPQAYQYTLEKGLGRAMKVPCAEPGAPLESTEGITFSRTVAAAESATPKSKAGQTVKFSGSVDLPTTKAMADEQGAPVKK